MVILYRSIFFSLASIFSLFQVGMAQQASSLPATDSISFDQFVRDVEQKTDYRFYYNPAHTDSLKVALPRQDQEVNAVLGQAFAGTDMHFIIDRNKKILITKGREIMSDLPVDFFDTGAQPRVETEAAFDFSEYEKREKQKKTGRVTTLLNRRQDH